jgi:Glucose / Sorbosone dehydrogenase
LLGLATRCLLLALPLLAVAAGPSHGRPHPAYRVPLDNPFVKTPGARAEIYVLGMRNPYRWSFDSATGDMWIGDVGGSRREEVTYLPRRRIGGANLGWPCFEGSLVVRTCKRGRYVGPVYEYSRNRDVVIGGFVSHDPRLPSLAGRYVFGRFRTGIWSLGPRGAGRARHTGVAIDAITSIGQDGVGRLYATAYAGPVYRLVETAGALGLEKIGDFARPVGVTGVAGDPNVLFVFEKAGRVNVVRDGQVSTFLDLSDRVRDDTYEEGLLGFVAAPDYAASGRVFAFYSDTEGNLQLDEYRGAEESTRRPLLRIRHDVSKFHNGGQLLFGPDGYLYASTGDGDATGDRDGDSQSLGSLLGKILRLDVSSRPADTTPPQLRASVRPTQPVLRRGGAAAHLSCSEPCSVVAGGRLRVGGRDYPLKAVGGVASKASEARLTVLLTRQGREALTRALPRADAASVHLRVRADDTSGNRSRTLVRAIAVSG